MSEESIRMFGRRWGKSRSNFLEQYFFEFDHADLERRVTEVMRDRGAVPTSSLSGETVTGRLRTSGPDIQGLGSTASYFGARGGGKSAVALVYVMEHLPARAFGLARRFQDQLSLTVSAKQYQKLLAECCPRPRGPKNPAAECKAQRHQKGRRQ